MSLLNPDLLEAISGRPIILDANAFTDGFRFPSEFSELIGELTSQACPVTTIQAVRLEFLSSNRTAKELEKKITFYNETITYPELPPRTFESELQEPSLLFAFGKQCQSFKAVDFMIAAAVKKYSPGVLLLTNDHHDFTPQLFDLTGLIPFTPGQGGVVPFGLYCFSEDKYAALLSKSSF